MPSKSTSQSLNALPPGTVLRDYVIESEIGSGGFSIVYLARHHLKSDWLYAIKEFLPGELAVRARDGATVHPVNTQAREAFEDGLRRFRDEAEQLRTFRNEPYIVSCLNYFEQNGTAYLVMDYDDGLPLSEFLRQREAAGQPFTEADLLSVIEPLLEGLAAVHRAGVLHRDIKPGNVFVRRQDDITGRPAHPVLIDFGAAKQNYLERHSRSRAPYTPGYAAYEQMSSEGDIGPWTDVYAVGALMWRMVAGGCPGDRRLLMVDGVDGADGAEVWSSTPRAAEKRAYALHRGRPDPMASAVELGVDRFSPTLLQAIDRCLVLYPEHRVENCEESRTLLAVPKAVSAGYDERAIADALNEAVMAYHRSEYEVALREFRKLAELGLAEAQFYLGDIYRFGEGVPEDHARALKWFTRAAEQGEAGAQHALGDIYRFGRGVPHDHAQALKWYTRAAEQEHTPAYCALGDMYENGTGVPKDQAQAVQWYTRAAKQGDADAQYRLGFMYLVGIGVRTDHVQAYAWTSLAIARGIDHAVEFRDEIAATLSEAQIAEAQQLIVKLDTRVQKSR